MRIQSIYAHNFKSLVDFNLELAQFTCLIGLNGAGKSTVLQLVDFLAQQARGDLKGWLAERGWKAADLNSRLTPSAWTPIWGKQVNSGQVRNSLAAVVRKYP